MANNYRKMKVDAKQLSELYGENFSIDFSRKTSSYLNKRGRFELGYPHELYLSWDGKPFDPGHMCLDDGTIATFLHEYLRLQLPAQVSYVCCEAKRVNRVEADFLIVLSYDPDLTVDCLTHTLVKIVWDGRDLICHDIIDPDLAKRMGVVYEHHYQSTDLLHTEQYLVVENKWLFRLVAEKYWSLMGSLLNRANTLLDDFEQHKKIWYEEWYKPVVIPELESLEGYSVEETSDSIIVTYPAKGGGTQVDEFRFGDLGWAHFMDVFLAILIKLKEKLDAKQPGLMDDNFMPSWYYATKLQDQICKNKEGTEHGK